MTQITDAQFLTGFWIGFWILGGILFLALTFMICIMILKNRKISKLRKNIKVGDIVNYQNRAVVIKEIVGDKVTFNLSVSKDNIFPLELSKHHQEKLNFLFQK